MFLLGIESSASDAFPAAGSRIEVLSFGKLRSWSCNLLLDAMSRHGTLRALWDTGLEMVYRFRNFRIILNCCFLRLLWNKIDLGPEFSARKTTSNGLISKDLVQYYCTAILEDL